MSLLCSSRMGSLLRFRPRFRLFSWAQGLASSPPRPPGKHRDSLYQRISHLGDPMVSMVPVLEGWIEEGKAVEKSELQRLIKQLRGFKRYKHALEISQWMTDRRYFDLSPSDVAVRLDLISKVQGVEHAEKYFNNISRQFKAIGTYNTLLHCYAQSKSVENAEALFREMKDLGLVDTLSYNALMNLYLQTGQYDKLDNVVKEMDENGIPLDSFALSIQMSRFAATCDVNGLEAVLKKVEDKPHVRDNWDVYSIAANGYKKAGLLDKAVEMLKRSEELVSSDRQNAYDFLLSMYAGIGQKDEVHRLWRLLKSSSKKVRNAAYISMIVSLAKLDDIEGAEKILDEWESQCSCYDFRVPNRLLVAYCKNGLIDKAEAFINKAIEGGRTPYPSTWECLATGYLENDQIPEGVAAMKKALSVKRQGWWKPNSDKVAACLEYFEVQGDVEGAEEFVRLLQHWIPLTRDVYHRLLRTYVAVGKSISDMLDRMKADGLDADEETHEILKTRQDI